MTDDDPWDSIYDALRVQWEQAFKYALEHECGGDEHKAAIETLEEFIAFSVRQAMMDGDIKEEAVPLLLQAQALRYTEDFKEEPHEAHDPGQVESPPIPQPDHEK
jgi:hypothetical protein